MKRKVIVLLVVMAMIMSMVACSQPSEPAPQPPADEQPGDETPSPSDPSEPAKTTLVYGVSTDAASLDPHVQNDSHSEQNVAMLYSTLLKFEADGTIVKDLAESYEVTEDGRTWTFKLKEGVTFHNGKELTAEDVKATYERFMADDADAARLVVKEITRMFESVDVHDKYTVSITTDEPYGPMMALLCNRSLAIMDGDIIAEHGYQVGDFVESTVGTGPFKIVSWRKDEELVVERYEDYFGENAKLEKIIVRHIPEAASRVIALENGELDMINQFPAEDLDRLEADANITVIKTPGVGARLFRFGCNDPIISNTLVRQAIVHAIDRDEIVEGLFPGLSYPTTGPITPVVWGYYNFGEIYQDLDKAKDLLAQAGYPDGFDTKIVTTPRYMKGVELAEVLSSQLSLIGINAEIEVLEWSVILPLWSGVGPDVFDQPMFIMGAGTSMMDADGAFRGLYTTTLTGTNERNYGFYSNEEVDELIYAGMSETNAEARYELYKRAQEILYLEDPTAIWLYDTYNTAASASFVKGVEINGVGMFTWENIYID
jgi:peptide/nickel transport system substrate-binding protein